VVSKILTFLQTTVHHKSQLANLKRLFQQTETM